MDPLSVWYGGHAALFLHEPACLGGTISNHHPIVSPGANLLAGVCSLIPLAWCFGLMEDHPYSLAVFTRDGTDRELVIPFIPRV